MSEPTIPAEPIVPEDDEDDYDENAIMPPTPGPWTIQPDSYDKWLLITAPDPDPKNYGMGRLEVQVLRDDVDSRVSLANARLIAAAPALLEALEAEYDEWLANVERLTANMRPEVAAPYLNCERAERMRAALSAARPADPEASS